MNIWKLLKDCTTAPLLAVHGKGTCFHDGNADSIIWWSKPLDPEEEAFAETVAEVWPTVPARKARNDAVLLVHCRNLFPILLNEAISVAPIVKWAIANGCPIPDAADKAKDLLSGIRRAKNVKTGGAYGSN